jgi:hypothetical protein
LWIEYPPRATHEGENHMFNEDKPTRLGVVVVTTVVVAVLLAALISGLWDYLYGRKEKRTPEMPQTTTCLSLRSKCRAGQIRFFAHLTPSMGRVAFPSNTRACLSTYFLASRTTAFFVRTSDVRISGLHRRPSIGALHSLSCLG